MAFSTHSIVPTHYAKLDFNGDGLTDLLWQGADGTTVAWHMAADGLSFASETYAPPPGGGMALRGTGDAEHNGTTDLVWQDAAGAIDVGVVAHGQVSIGHLGTAGTVGT